MKNKRKRLIGLTAVAVVLVAIAAACVIYVSDCYPADILAILSSPHYENVTQEVLDEDLVGAAFVGEEADVGFIFYPGGKVDDLAYWPLMEACAAEGMVCVVVQMPFNLAVLDIKAADGIQEMYPEIEKWYIGGHSLGGSMAASYLEDNVEEYEGLILLGSYSTADLSETDLKALSIYGSEDRVLNREKYAENKLNLPDDFTEVVLEGGCHAYFGMYGAQEGDGTPTISNEEQIEQTVAAIAEFVKD